MTYTVDGLTMVGYLARPDGAGPWPAVLIGHDGIGLNDYQRGYADDLATRGYVALAMDYHGGRWYSNFDELLARVLPLIADPDRLRTIGRAALEVLLADPNIDRDRLAGIGLGAGGNIILEVARGSAQFRVVAAVHPGLPLAGRQVWTRTRASYLLATGSEDPLCTPDQVLAFSQQLQDAGEDWRVHIYGGATHGFWHPPVNTDGTLADVTQVDATQVDATQSRHAGHHRAHAQRLWHDIVTLLDERLATAT